MREAFLFRKINIMGIFDKVKSLFQATEDKKDKTSKIEIDKKLKIQSKSDPEPELEPESDLDLESKSDPEPELEPESDLELESKS